MLLTFLIHYSGLFSCVWPAVLIKVQCEGKTYLGMAAGYLNAKCKEAEASNAKSFGGCAKSMLLQWIEKKTRNPKLYKVRVIPDPYGLSSWLKRGNIYAKDEVRDCYLNDRNMFSAGMILRPNCKAMPKTVDQLAMKYDGMLYHGYTRTYNEVV